jgi:hypothetical protein
MPFLLSKAAMALRVWGPITPSTDTYGGGYPYSSYNNYYSYYTPISGYNGSMVHAVVVTELAKTPLHRCKG